MEQNFIWHTWFLHWDSGWRVPTQSIWLRTSFRGMPVNLRTALFKVGRLAVCLMKRSFARGTFGTSWAKSSTRSRSSWLLSVRTLGEVWASCCSVQWQRTYFVTPAALFLLLVPALFRILQSGAAVRFALFCSQQTLAKPHCEPCRMPSRRRIT